MTSRPANKHELKTKETRELLLQAAETIFVRDGYEGSDLAEIAALAGRTKGAIYAQFASKEDIFLALIEAKRLRFRARAEKHLSESSTIEGNLIALRNYYQEQAVDETWPLLMLEFKLFAIRHPESKTRVLSLIAESLSPNDEKRIAVVLGPAAKGKNAISRVTAIKTIQTVLSALALEAKFDNTNLDEAVSKRIIARIFDALMNSPAS